MNMEYGKQRILIHAGFVISEKDNDLGLLQQLYEWNINIEVEFADLMQALVTLHLGLDRAIDMGQETLSAIWEIISLGRARIERLKDIPVSIRSEQVNPNVIAQLVQIIQSIDRFVGWWLKKHSLAISICYLCELLTSGAISNGKLFEFLIPTIHVALKNGPSDSSDVLQGLEEGLLFFERLK